MQAADLGKLEAAYYSDVGRLLSRAIDLRAALKMGITLRLEDIPAEEFEALRIIEDEQQQWEAEERERNR